MKKKISKLFDRFVETHIDDEIVIMHVDNGDFFSITGTGMSIWKLIDGEVDRDFLLDHLCDEFEGVREQVSLDLDEFLGKMKEAGLLDVE